MKNEYSHNRKLAYHAKYSFSIIITFFTLFQINGQTFSKSEYYMTAGYNRYQNIPVFQMSLNASFNHKMSYSIRKINGRVELNPKNYYYEKKPFHKVEGHEILVSRQLRFGKHKRIRFKPFVGLGRYESEKVIDWGYNHRQPCDLTYFGCAFYNVFREEVIFEIEESNYWSIVIAPQVEFSGKFVGIYLNTQVEINKENKFFGIGLGFMFGSMNNTIYSQTKETNSKSLY